VVSTFGYIRAGERHRSRGGPGLYPCSSWYPLRRARVQAGWLKGLRDTGKPHAGADSGGLRPSRSASGMKDRSKNGPAPGRGDLLGTHGPERGAIGAPDGGTAGRQRSL